MTALLFFLLSACLAAPALFLLRQPKQRAFYASLALFLLATSSAYIGVQLRQKSPNPPAKQSQTPFQLNAQNGQFQIITPADLPRAIAASRGRTVLIEFYADWCSSCIVWKTTVFNRADVQAALKPLVLLQIDASNITPDVQALLNQYQLAGLPAILVYSPEGAERANLRLLGEMSAPAFIHWVRALTSSTH